MLESIVGFLAKVAFWAFVVGIGLGIYLGVRYAPEAHAVGNDVSCVVPATPTDTGPSG